MAELKTKLVRPLRSGQITIPAEFRERLGIGPDSVLQMSLTEGELRIKPLHVTHRAAGSPWLKDLYDLFAPVRQEAAQSSEPDLDAAISRAVRAVRRKRA